MKTAEVFWVSVGLFGQFLFFMRFLIQWIVTEKNKKSTIPVAFWFFSISGGIILLVYSIYRKDPVFILGQGLGVLIYSRNLYYIYKYK